MKAVHGERSRYTEGVIGSCPGRVIPHHWMSYAQNMAVLSVKCQVD